MERCFFLCSWIQMNSQVLPRYLQGALMLVPSATSSAVRKLVLWLANVLISSGHGLTLPAEGCWNSWRGLRERSPSANQHGFM